MTTYLGFYLGHDSNISVSINGKIKYRKSERFYQEKHHLANYDFVLNTLKDWNINKIDYCAYTDGNRQNLGKCDINELFCKGKLKEFPSYCIDHHYAHALSIWPIKNTEEIDYSVVVDGKGDWDRSMMVIKNPAINPKIINREEGFSLGFEFFLMGKMLNFSGLEYDFAGKLMGLQSYSEDEIEKFNLPKLVNTNYKSILKFSKNANYTTYNEWHEYWWKYLKNIFNFPETSTIGYSGGCAQNSVYNYRLKNMFPNLHIPPHCYDGGLSLGCLEFLRLKFNKEKFDNINFPFWQDDIILENPTEKTIKIAAKLLSQNKIIGWVQNAGELGPRALGNRSILMNATNAENKNTLNNRVKKREAWRPYAGSILKEFSKDYFDIEESKYMLYACNVLNNKIPAITHVDKTCRMQTVENNNNPFYDLIREYYNITNIPVILNTSLNIMGNPIVSKMTISTGRKIIKTCNLDNLIIGNKIIYNTKMQ